MNISSICIKRPVATVMVILMVVVIGVASLMGIKQDLFPNIKLPVAVVMTTYGTASPEEVEKMITEPVEQALASVENYDTMMSMSSQGSSVVMIQFKMGTDMNFATLNMREKIARAKRMLPSDAGDPTVIKMDMSSIPINQVFVSSDMPVERLNTIVEDELVNNFERASGVASISVLGGVEKEISAEFNPERLAGYGITLAQISQILSSENLNMPSGEVAKGDTKIMVRTMGEFQSVEDINNLPITLPDRSIVRLGDIANISDAHKEQDSLSKIDGKNAIGILVTKQSDANTVETSREIRKIMDNLSEKYPEITFTMGFDQAEYIEKSISSVASSALSGGLLAILVVFLFLKNVRSTLVIGLSIPVSLLTTFALMSARGMTLNMITMCSLTLAVGMLVDNAIVVLENIFRLRQETGSAVEAAEKGSKEIFLAILSSTLTTVVVFLPIALADGIAGMMFEDFCFTIIIALVSSLFVALTAVPMFSSLLLSSGLSTDYVRLGTHRYKYRFLPKFTALIENTKEAYGNFMTKALQKRKRVLAICTGIFVLSIALVGVVGTELMPASDEGEFTVDVTMPNGTSFEKKVEKMAVIEDYVLQIPELKHAALSVGQTSAMSGSSNSIDVMLVDKQDRKRSVDEIVDQANRDLSQISGVDVDVTASSSMSMSMGSSADIQLELKGKEMDQLNRIGEYLCKVIETRDDVKSAEVSTADGNPELRVMVDRSTAAYYGVSASQVANGLSTALSGSTATKLKVDGEEIEINLSLPDSYGKSIENMKQITVMGTSGQLVPVGQIASFEVTNAPTTINRQNQTRYITIDIETQGNDLMKTTNAITSWVEKYPFPDGYYYESGGTQEEMMEAFGSLLKALVVAIALVYLILAAQFESVTLPLMVMISIPFAMTGAFLALFITGTTLSMVSFLGLIMLVGIVVNNAILLVEFINQNRDKMEREKALILAGKLRMRPILMSSGTTCIGMLPLALGLGDGGETLAPMGISIIGGLMASTLVTLIIVPIIYSIFDDGKQKRQAKRKAKHDKIAALEAKWHEEDMRHA